MMTIRREKSVVPNHLPKGKVERAKAKARVARASHLVRQVPREDEQVILLRGQGMNPVVSLLLARRTNHLAETGSMASVPRGISAIFGTLVFANSGSKANVVSLVARNASTYTTIQKRRMSMPQTDHLRREGEVIKARKATKHHQGTRRRQTIKAS